MNQKKSFDRTGGESSIDFPGHSDSPQPSMRHKRPFVKAFVEAFDERRLSKQYNESSQLFENFLSPARPGPRDQAKYNTLMSDSLRPQLDNDTTIPVSPSDSNAVTEKFTTLVHTVSACAYAGADLMSSLVQQGSKHAYSYLKKTTDEAQHKRQRLESDTSQPQQSELRRDDFFALVPRDMTGILLPSLRIPGSFDQPICRPSEPDHLDESVFEEYSKSSPSPLLNKSIEGASYSATPKDVEPDMVTPEKRPQNGTGSGSRIYWPPVTPSFRTYKPQSSIVPDSIRNNDPKAMRLFSGLKRQKLGILDHISSHSPSLQSLSPIATPTKPSNFIQYGGFNSNEAKTFQFDHTRLMHRKPLPYTTSWYYQPPKIELPEQASSTEKYVELYMALVALREQREKETREEEKRKEREAVPKLDRLAVRKVEALWARRDESTELVFAYRIGISVYDLGTLKDGQWLNDNIIDFYLSMVTERSQKSKGSLPNSFAFSTHFFSTLQTRGYSGVARWAKRKGIDVTKQDFIFVPINRHNTHWCLAVINNRDMRFEFYDSMNGAGTQALHLLRDYMCAQTMATYPESNPADLGYDKYELCSTLQCPQQKNSFDCGVFVSKMVEVLSKDLPIMSFSQNDMPNIRRRMAHEITHQHLLESVY